MSPREHLVRRTFDELWSRGEPAVAHDVGNVTFHHGGATVEVGSEAFLALVADWRRGFPDLTFTVEDLVEQDESVAVRARMQGTQTGPWRDRPPSGRAIDVDVMMFFRFEGHDLVEIWEVDDRLRRDAQLDGQEQHGPA